MTKQFKVPIRLLQLSTDPSVAAAGDIYFNSSDLKIKFYSGTEWLPVGSGSAGGGTTNHSHDYNGNVIVGSGGSLVTTATFFAGAPNNINGENGDVYVDITNLNVYVKASGSWGSPTEINVYTKNEVDQLLSSIDTSIATKAPLASPTFTGTVILPALTSIGDVSNTEISYLDGVTSAIQTQLDSKVSSSNLSNSLGDYIPQADRGFADGVAATDSDGNILVPLVNGAGIKFTDNTIQTTAFNSSGFATFSQLSDVEALALAGL